MRLNYPCDAALLCPNRRSRSPTHCATPRRTPGAGGRDEASEIADLDELTFMLWSGSDRTGALDFQASPGDYVPREADNETLDRLFDAADRVDRGLSLAPDLTEALQHGTAIGGARPKALIRDGDTKYVAKLSSSTDTYSVVKAEFIAMRLAGLVGLNVAPVRLVRPMNKDALLIRRFDREPAENGWTRRAMVSALTLLGLDERFTAPAETLRELFARLVFNILVGNTDDHARNHTAFWDGDGLTLTPAYDICPQSRTGREVSQAMQVHGRERRSQQVPSLGKARPGNHAEPGRRHRGELGRDRLRGGIGRCGSTAALAAAIRERPGIRRPGRSTH